MIGKKSSGRTAAEIGAEIERMLHEDPEYRARWEAADAERQARADKLTIAERPIVENLRSVGLNLDSVWDLVNTAEPYPKALPILMKHLELGGYPGRVMESMARALAVKAAHEYWPRLRELYLRAEEPDEVEGLAVALAGSATREYADDLIDLLWDDSRGDSRIHFLWKILKVAGERGREVVESLVDDPVLGKEATALMKRRRRR